MLTYKLTGDILEVKETTDGWITSAYSYWYYDIVNWRQSSKGQENDEINRDMTPAGISWVKTHYLPKVLKMSRKTTVIAMQQALIANEKFINKVNNGLAKSIETYDDLTAVNILLRKAIQEEENENFSSTTE